MVFVPTDRWLSPVRPQRSRRGPVLYVEIAWPSPPPRHEIVSCRDCSSGGYRGPSQQNRSAVSCSAAATVSNATTPQVTPLCGNGSLGVAAEPSRRRLRFGDPIYGTPVASQARLTSSGCLSITSFRGAGIVVDGAIRISSTEVGEPLRDTTSSFPSPADHRPYVLQVADKPLDKGSGATATRTRGPQAGYPDGTGRAAKAQPLTAPVTALATPRPRAPSTVQWDTNRCRGRPLPRRSRCPPPSRSADRGSRSWHASYRLWARRTAGPCPVTRRRSGRRPRRHRSTGAM